VRRGAVAAALLAAAAVGIVAAVSTGSSDPAARASSLDQVVSQVRTSFGDDHIASARADGSTLGVVLAFPGSSSPALMKSEFEAQVLAAAVAYWMRSYGEEPITTVRYRDRRDLTLLGTAVRGDPVPATADVSPLRPRRCEAVARASVRPPLTVASARTLPYLHGTCVFRFRTSEPVAGSGAAMAVLGRLIHGIGDPNDRPWFFELDDRQGTPLDGASWMPGLNGSTWAKPGLAYALAHE
jgi:hypothetical protein